MPRRPKFTKEEVLKSAYEVAQKEGIDSVTAASVAAHMGYTGSSLFTHFDSMDEIKNEVYRKAKHEALDYFSESVFYAPSFKEFGMRFISFAKKEPHLYRMLFSNNPFIEGEDISGEFDALYELMQKEVEKLFDLSEKDAKELIVGSVTYANGMAMYIINGNGEQYTEERISRELSTYCLGRVLMCKAKEGKLTTKMAEILSASTDNLPVHK